MRGKQVVLTTALGDIVIDLLPEHAPNHVGLFMKTAQDGGLTGTIFHRVVRQGIVQGGDPLTKDPATRARAGTGGLNLVAREGVAEKHTRGAVSAVIVPGRPDSGGTQFFICIVDQPSLDGQHTVFGRVSEGLRIAQAISEGAADEKGVPVEPVAVTAAVVRDKPAETPPAYSTESVEALAAHRAVLETSLGDITIAFTPDKAPDHVRNFLRLAELGAYDGTTWHRVVKGFVVQTGMMSTRKTPLTEAQERHVHQIAGRVQRSAARRRRRLDGAPGGARFGQHLVLHRHGARRLARREVHRVRQGRGGPRGGLGHRSRAGERRDAGDRGHAAAGAYREAVRAGPGPLARARHHYPLSSKGKRGPPPARAARSGLLVVSARLCMLTPSSRTGRVPASVLSSSASARATIAGASRVGSAL